MHFRSWSSSGRQTNQSEWQCVIERSGTVGLRLRGDYVVYGQERTIARVYHKIGWSVCVVIWSPLIALLRSPLPSAQLNHERRGFCVIFSFFVRSARCFSCVLLDQCLNLSVCNTVYLSIHCSIAAACAKWSGEMLTSKPCLRMSSYYYHCSFFSPRICFIFIMIMLFCSRFIVHVQLWWVFFFVSLLFQQVNRFHFFLSKVVVGSFA